MPVLSAEDVHIHYGSVRAVQGVTFDVQEGEVLGVIGANGAGKSTLLKGLVGLVPLAAGTVHLDGADVSHVPAERRVRRGVALSPEGRGVLTGMSVRENLELGAYSAAHTSRREIRERLAETFELFPVLADRQAQPAQTLSGGEAAMLSVGRAFVAQPRVLLLDEPTLGLAPIMSERLFERIGALKARGMTMVIVEQRATALFDVADRVLQMKQGVQQGLSNVGELDAEALTHLYFGAA
jgi:branched-chain amino acid transport system ATP-binding protein